MTTKIKEEYLNEDLPKIQSDKCGEIFVTESGMFSCFCIVCKQNFEEIGIFTEHILTLHLGLIPPKTGIIPYLEKNNDIVPLELEVSHNFLEMEMFKNKNMTKDTPNPKASNKNIDITLNKNISTDALDLCKVLVQPVQNENKNSAEAVNKSEETGKSEYSSQVGNKLKESELSEFTEIINYKSKSPDPDSSENSDRILDEYLEIRPFNCDICKKMFKIERAFVLHKKQHETLMPSCQHCGKYFRQQTSFKTHNQILCAQRIKRGHKKLELPDIKCKYCEKFFKNTGSLKKHEALHEDSPYKCNTCQKKFMAKYLLEDHIRTHTGEKPYKCKYCSVSFANASNLKRHNLTHVGERKYICSLGCDKAFYTAKDRAGHERIHTGEKPFVCELCGRYFAFQHQLSLHKRRSHMDKKNWSHKCDKCNKVFLTPQLLREHIVVHTGEKPYECNICFGRFSKACGLREHKKLHSGVKKHVCKICNKAFAQTAGLYGHIKSHKIIKENAGICERINKSI